jgi:hypothetical protein
LPELPLRRSLSEQFHLLLELARWIPVSVIVGIMAGSASALLLVSLDYSTKIREQHTCLITKERACPYILAF